MDLPKNTMGTGNFGFKFDIVGWTKPSSDDSGLSASDDFGLKIEIGSVGDFRDHSSGQQSLVLKSAKNGYLKKYFRFECVAVYENEDGSSFECKSNFPPNGPIIVN